MSYALALAIARSYGLEPSALFPSRYTPFATLGAPSTLGDTPGPALQAALDKVKAQVLAEGGLETDAEDAQGALQNSWNQLTGSTQIISPNDDPIAAATTFALNRYAPSSAITQVTSLATAVASGSVPQIVNALGGTLIAVAGASSAVSFGAGAAIAAGVAVAEAVIDLLGTSQAPQLSTSCGDYNWGTTTAPLHLVSGCVVTNAKNIQPNETGLWRRFPTRTNLEDVRVWYTDYAGAAAGATSTLTTWGSTIDPNQVKALWGGPKQLAYGAWPELFHIECEIAHYQQGTNALWDFFFAFFAAWKINKEYGLNGIQPATDPQVLDQVLLLWNRAHQAGTPIIMQPRAKKMLTYGVDTCDLSANAAPVPYVSMLIGEIQGVDANGNMSINAGPLKTIGAVAGATSASSSTGTTVALVAGGAALFVGGWFLLGQPHSLHALTFALKHLGSPHRDEKR